MEKQCQQQALPSGSREEKARRIHGPVIIARGRLIHNEGFGGKQEIDYGFPRLFFIPPAKP
ncbi:MAG TPA: hypothetical protein VLG93_03575 [Sulfuricaulis sp.]|nr:hypothetical protein [Sulfuricaulis sp.]